MLEKGEVKALEGHEGYENIEESPIVAEDVQQHVEGWTKSIMNRISGLTAPLMERFESYTQDEIHDNISEPVNSSETAFQTMTDPPSERSEENADDHVPSKEKGILQRIANFARPLSEYVKSYAPEPEPAAKENMLKSLKDRFNRRFAKEKLEPTWKDNVLDKITTLTSPLPERFDIPVTFNGIDINNLSQNHMLVGIGGVILLLFLRRRRIKAREQIPARRSSTSASSHDGAIARAMSRSGSFDALLRMGSMTRERSGTIEDVLDEALKTDEDTPLVFGGPGVPAISYETWTPPMQWTEASRMLLPTNTDPEQRRKVTLNFQDGTLTREEQSGQDQTFTMANLSLHVKSPITGGVFEIYVKGAPKHEWMEHTFKSAHQAAQFQQDLINYQVVGESIKNMYESLELIQKGSMAHDGKECVLHDDTSDTKKGAVAWDDCMRCFSGIKSVRKALELDLVHRIINNNNEGEETAVTEDYVNNRLLLGQFDFFRLFVPTVEPTALPQGDSNPARVTELLERRKRVARASVMVQAFVHARKVANKGWNLHIDLPEESFTKRLAYDEDIDNIQRDATAKNEYYEATVSRDVRCEVHSAKHLEKPGSSVVSQYQAFSLVGSQVFKLPPKGERHPLSHRKDPVLSLPSLRKLVEAHPELDFFVCAFFPDGLGVAIVHVFVRSLPRGVDASFDNNVRTLLKFRQSSLLVDTHSCLLFVYRWTDL